MTPALPARLAALLILLPSLAIASRHAPSADLVNDPAKAHAHPGAALLREQVLLDRAHFSPGEIDGTGGGNTRAALAGFQAAHGLDASGKLDDRTWEALEQDPQPVLISYTLTTDDVAGPFLPVPDDIEQQATLPHLGYATVQEALGEKFHASPALLQRLNPDAVFAAGEVLVVPNVLGETALPPAARVVVDRSDSVVRLLDAQGAVQAQFPASMGSEHDPLPLGEWTIRGITRDPVFHYDPLLFWDADPLKAKATVQPGPNNPVGAVWIDLSREHYGLHGTPEPGTVGKAQSHGCIRLTNWDALTVATAVKAGTPVTLQE